MEKRNIIVIGASAGGFEAFKTLVAGLPADLDASVFLVWHTSPNVPGILPRVLGNLTEITVKHAVHGEKILSKHIYVAPPDYHLMLEDGHIQITHGPKENRFRPAIDPLFRSAAYAYGNRVIGVVLSGALDDGTAGLWAVKDRGGIAVVQDPEDAAVASMPTSAIREVAVDHIVPIAEMAPLLSRLCREEVNGRPVPNVEEDKRIETEINMAAEKRSSEDIIMQFGELSPFACPECNGVLTLLRDGKFRRYRCHTGHSYTAESLLSALSENVEDSLYGALRGADESVLLLNHIGGHFAEINQETVAALYFQRAKEAHERVEMVRKVIQAQRQFSIDKDPSMS